MANRDETLKKNDKVTWRSHGQDVEGRVVHRITERVEAAGRTVAASPEEPQFKVKSDRTGREAVHRAEALHRRP